MLFILKKPRNGRFSNKYTETCFLRQLRHSYTHLSIDATHYEACQDTHYRLLRSVQNEPQTAQKHIQMADKWKIFTFKRQKINGKFFKHCRGTSIFIYPRHSPVHFSINPTQCEIVRTPRGVQNIQSPTPNCPLTLLSCYIVDSL